MHRRWDHGWWDHHGWGPRGDVILAVLMTAFVVAISRNIPAADGEREIDALGIIVMVIASGALAFRRRAPVVVLAVIGAALLAYTWREYAGGPVYTTIAVAFFTLGDERGWRDALAPSVAVGAVLVIGGFLAPDGGGDTPFHTLAFPGWAAAALLGGSARRGRRLHAESMEERARLAEETREEEARRRVAEERLRIARDLHDVIAHGIAAISLQSGVAAHVLDRQPEQAAEALRAIRRTSNETLHELRATLDVLRADGDDDAPRAPTPGLDRIDGLLDTARRSGLAVELVVDGVAVRLPAAVDLAAYRIVQESLTNVMRHAHASQAIVTVRHREDAVEVEVVDDGRGAATGGGGGHGTAGMRERAALVGGALEVGPRSGGGFRVWARLPVTTGEEVTT